jgi:hypothetical protein
MAALTTPPKLVGGDDQRDAPLARERNTIHFELVPEDEFDAL